MRGLPEAVGFPGGGAVGALRHVHSLRWSDSASRGALPSKGGSPRQGSDANFHPCERISQLQLLPAAFFSQTPNVQRGGGPGGRGRRDPPSDLRLARHHPRACHVGSLAGAKQERRVLGRGAGGSV